MKTAGVDILQCARSAWAVAVADYNSTEDISVSKTKPDFSALARRHRPPASGRSLAHAIAHKRHGIELGHHVCVARGRYGDARALPKWRP